jgi:hypothetical protein
VAGCQASEFRVSAFRGGYEPDIISIHPASP